MHGHALCMHAKQGLQGCKAVSERVAAQPTHPLSQIISPMARRQHTTNSSTNMKPTCAHTRSGQAAQHSTARSEAEAATQRAADTARPHAMPCHGMSCV